MMVMCALRTTELTLEADGGHFTGKVYGSPPPLPHGMPLRNPRIVAPREEVGVPYQLGSSNGSVRDDRNPGTFHVSGVL